MALSIAFLCVRPVRFLASYLFLGATFAFLGSLVLSFGLLLALSKFLGGTGLAWVSLVGHIAGMGIGGLIGCLLGLCAARTFNRALPWFSRQGSGGVRP